MFQGLETDAYIRFSFSFSVRAYLWSCSHMTLSDFDNVMNIHS